jgi:hypothetical protein
MSKLEHTRSLINKLTNIYKSGGVKQALSDSCFDDVNPFTHTCGRLFARAVQKVAFVVSIAFMLGACQKAYLIPSEGDESSRHSESTTKEKKDTTNVDVNIDAEGWEGAIDADFTFGGEEEQENE